MSSQRRFSALLVAALTGLALAACTSQAARPPAPRPAASSAHPAGSPDSPAAGESATAARIYDVLLDMQADAFNPKAPPATGAASPGGLFINWRGSWGGAQATAGANTNLQEDGLSDQQADSAPRHDPLTDLTYLVNLYAYQALYPRDRQFAPDATRMEPVVRQEYAAEGYYRCWVYFQLRDLDELRPGQGWGVIADRFATGVYRHYYDRQAGAIADPRHDGVYRTDFAAECGAMLIDAGYRHHETALIKAGNSALTHLLRQAQNPRTSLFPLQLQLEPGRDTVVQAQVTVGEEAQLLGAFLDAYELTGNKSYLGAVVRTVNSMYSPAIGLWDPVHGGFFFSVDADGSDLQARYKESRQAWMLPLLTNLARIEHGGVWAARQRQMLTVVRDMLWQSAIHGYPYRETPGFTTYQTTNGPGHTLVVEDWVTSEAMGIACESLAAELLPLKLSSEMNKSRSGAWIGSENSWEDAGRGGSACAWCWCWRGCRCCSPRRGRRRALVRSRSRRPPARPGRASC